MILSKTKPTVFLYLFLGLMAALFASCASSNPYAKLDSAVIDDDFAAALTVIDESLAEGGEPIYTEDNSISLLLDKGVISHYAALKGQSIEGKGPVDFRSSSENLAEAETKIEEAASGNTAQSILTFIANDNSKDYPGEAYEDIYLTIFNALNYYQQGEIDNAIALLRSANEKITAYSDAAGKSLDVPADSGDAGEGDDGALAAAIGQVRGGVTASFDTVLTGAYDTLGASKDPVEFSNSALADYLAALAFRAKGDEGSARVSLDNLSKAYADSPGVYYTPVPASVAEELSVPAGKARLNFIAFAGAFPVKAQAEIPASLPSALFPNVGASGPVTLLVPRMVNRTIPADRVKFDISIENGPAFQLELLEDMGAVVKGVFRNKLPGTLFKTFLRVTAKYIAVEAAVLVAEQKASNDFAKAAAKVAAMGAGKAAIDATEGADTRMSRYFPCYAYAGGVTLDPGTYTITVTCSNGYSVKKENFEVKAGGLNLVEVVSVNRE
ncbi:MAG: hypothetical protein LBT68_03210 [Spirochaetales bacterium]|jgi:hypothetical protein|nr:hypothetical protein [Spirochaetales bacterium]